MAFPSCTGRLLGNTITYMQICYLRAKVSSNQSEPMTCLWYKLPSIGRSAKWIWLRAADLEIAVMINNCFFFREVISDWCGDGEPPVPSEPSRWRWTTFLLFKIFCTFFLLESVPWKWWIFDCLSFVKTRSTHLLIFTLGSSKSQSYNFYICCTLLVWHPLTQWPFSVLSLQLFYKLC